MHKGQWHGALMFVFLIYAWKKRVSKQSWGWWFETPRAHYDVIVMKGICRHACPLWYSICTFHSFMYMQRPPTWFKSVLWGHKAVYGQYLWYKISTGPPEAHMGLIKANDMMPKTFQFSIKCTCLIITRVYMARTMHYHVVDITPWHYAIDIPSSL